MKHLFLDCIHKKAYVPILIELRDLNSEEKNLDELINETLSSFGFNTSAEYVQNAKAAGHFCYLLDGFDEITQKLRNKVIKQISVLSKKFTQCPIFISSRPDDILTGLDEFSTFGMRPLELSEALELVNKLPFDEIIKNKFCTNLTEGLFEEHYSFLSNPLLLSIMLLTYGENAEIPSKLSIFYNQAYEALFRRHDAYKGAYSRDRLTTLDIQDFSRVFSLFCLQTYEKRLFKMPRNVCLEFIQKSLNLLRFEVNPEDYLCDLLSAACLLIEDGLEITFSHRSFQEYFVALYISSAAPENQVRLINRFWINLNSDSVMQLLREINPELFERSLLVPKLDELFAELKVKRTVGISHLVRYLKLMYSRLDFDNVEDRGLTFTYKHANCDLRICQNMLLRILVKDFSKFPYISTSEIEKNGKMMHEKYFQDEQSYEVASLNIKAPILSDLNVNGAWHSVHFLATAHDVFKKLKAQHLNTSQSFDLLLGLK